MTNEKPSKRGGKRPGAGRKPFSPTKEERAMVEEMAGKGMTQEHIGALIRDGIEESTLREHFKKELVRGKAKACMAVGGSLFQKATIDKDSTAMIWWTKTQMGWSENKRVELTGADGGPLQYADAKDALTKKLLAKFGADNGLEDSASEADEKTDS